ncbi:hypothetical protein JVY00_08550 [Tsukamurella tyrosinosolvens]|uniref:DUF5994 family protein n=1 Tax=Tsukamurella tyrosinosolvens TaxID=57704 RepID=UPI001AF4C33B|nr:DUF5994 family protein [Tsukamurella tyrosinosolvens]QRY86087.1 hypothetical protein JVY00_08550 [Tsukamurella tyrosinosolvens]
MNEHLRRDITNHTPARNGMLLAQPFPSPTRTVRLTIEHGPKFWYGMWRPWTTNYAAEIHDLAHACGNRVGADISRIAFAWNKASLSHRSLMTADDLTLTHPEPGQPPQQMRATATNGLELRLEVKPPGSIDK